MRAAAAGFAIASLIYWQFLAPFFMIMIAFGADDPNGPAWLLPLLAMLSFVPALVYAILCYSFVRWAVRRYGTGPASRPEK